MPYYLKERIEAQPRLLGLLAHGLWFFLQSLFVSWRGARSRAFARLYSKFGPLFAVFEAQATPVPRLVGMADGIVLELGPGSGGQLPRFNISNISRIYGVESNEELCDRLRNGIIEQHGLSDIYVPINAALENSKLLEEEWHIGAESIDSVVCMQVLCSVQDPAAAAKQIHRLLKPGGQLLFWEHRASQDWVTRHLQGLYDLLWPHLVGCNLSRNIEQALMDAGDWKIVELDREEEPWQMMPRVSGRFTKL